MTTEPENLLGSVTNSYASARQAFSRFTTLYALATFKIRRGKPEENLLELERRLKLSPEKKQFLEQLSTSKAGAKFVDEKIQDMNLAAFHRSAFILNALVQLLFVDLGSQLGVSLPWLKFLLVLANLLLALSAQLARLKSSDELIAGPNSLPPKRRLFGLVMNRGYNRAVKKRSRPYAKQAWRESALYRPAYFLNAALLFFGSKFIIPVDQLIFPFGLIFGKAIGLITTLAMIFDIWRGVKAGDDARLAREKEVSVFRDLSL